MRIFTTPSLQCTVYIQYNYFLYLYSKQYWCLSASVLPASAMGVLPTSVVVVLPTRQWQYCLLVQWQYYCLLVQWQYYLLVQWQYYLFRSITFFYQYYFLIVPAKVNETGSTGWTNFELEFEFENWSNLFPGFISMLADNPKYLSFVIVPSFPQWIVMN